MKNGPVLHSFQVILPEHHLPQGKIVDWILKAHEKCESLQGQIPDPQKFKDGLKRFSLNEKFIHERYFECNELDEDWDSHEIYRLTPELQMGEEIELRNVFFGRKAAAVCEKIYSNATPKHLIHVTCTGYISPSPPQVYFSKKGESPKITHAYHMGCYASMPAIRMAMAFSEAEKEEVDILHTEMCSLHLNPAFHSPEQMVVQTLFADGHIKYCVGENRAGLVIKALHEKMVPNSLGDMTWTPGPFGMMMTLSREVPFKIRDSIPAFITELCQKAKVDVHKILQEGIFAIHPGGPKIIEAVQKKLEISNEQVKFSQKVLKERGNMSSATLPHVWKEILDSHPQNGTLVLSLAFGPGLTVFGSIFEVRR